MSVYTNIREWDTSGGGSDCIRRRVITKKFRLSLARVCQKLESGRFGTIVLPAASSPQGSFLGACQQESFLKPL